MNLTFVLTNDKHHHAMMWPVARRLAARHRIHCLSFAEFRGLDTPVADWKRLGATVTRVPARNIRPKAETADAILAIGAAGGAGRSRMHAVVWHGLLRHFVRLKSPDLVVLPNDTAYPSNYLVAKLKRCGIPYLLVQEGIRFPLPGETAGAYGTGGGDVACWGAGSAAFFRSQGVPDSKIHVTGNPRYDDIVGQDWRVASARLKADGELPTRYLLFASNPIDDQGFCTTQQKYEGFRRFAEQAVPALDSAGLKLAVKLHGRESILAFREVLGALKDRVVFLGPGNIHAQLAGAEAVVVWASTVGVEAILHGVPIGVLDIPGHGHVFDYVDCGAALGLRGDEALAPQIQALLKGDPSRVEGARAYLEHHLSCRGRSAEAVEALVEITLHRVALNFNGVKPHWRSSAPLKDVLRFFALSTPLRGIAERIYSALISLELSCFRLSNRPGQSGTATSERSFDDLTIIIKTFERPVLLRRLLESIRARYPNIKIIVADDSLQAIKLSGVEYLTLPFNSGVSAGRMAALDRVSTPFFLTLDDDFVFYEATRLEPALDLIRRHEDVDILGGVVVVLPLLERNDSSLTGLWPTSAEPVRPVGSRIGELVVRDKVPNFFIGRTERVRTVGWDPQIRRIDHEDFFTRARGTLLTVLYADFHCLHCKTPFDRHYMGYRSDFADDVALLEKRYGVRREDVMSAKK